MGVMRILDHFEMYSMDNVNMAEISFVTKEENLSGPPRTVLCSRGFWVSLYTITASFKSNLSMIALYKNGRLT